MSPSQLEPRAHESVVRHSGLCETEINSGMGAIGIMALRHGLPEAVNAWVSVHSHPVILEKLVIGSITQRGACFQTPSTRCLLM